MATVDGHQTQKNFILDSLPPEEYALLQPHLKLVQLQQEAVLVGLRQPITQVYFPTTATLSCLSSTTEGDIVEVGVTGFEGMVGTPLLLNQTVAPWQVEVQLPGEAFQLSAETFATTLQQSVVLKQKVNHYVYQKIVQLTQSALCNCFHAVEQRLCRCLLTAQDRVETPDLLLTRDVLAKMVGSPRPTVSLITNTLQAAGLIRAGQGRVTVLNREEMEESACDCYRVVKQEFDRYLQS